VYPFWSPDARALGFFAEGKLKRLDIGATKSIALADVVGMRGGAWGADGTILFARGTVGTLFRVPASGGNPLPVGTLAQGQSNHRFPVFLPGGRKFLYFALGTTDTQGIYLGSLDSPEVTKLTSAASAGSYLEGGWLLWVREGVLVAQKIDEQQRRLVGAPVTVADQLTYDGTTFVPAVSVSAGGAMIYRTGGGANRQLQWFDARGQSLGPLGMPDEYLINPRLSPDGTRTLVFRTVDGNSDVWLIDDVRSSRVTVAPASEQFPIWTADGKRVVFRSNPKGVYDLFVAVASSSGSERPLFESAQDKVANDWSRDAKYLSFQSNDSKTGWNLWAMPLMARANHSSCSKHPLTNGEATSLLMGDGSRITRISQGGTRSTYARSSYRTPERLSNPRFDNGRYPPAVGCSRNGARTAARCTTRVWTDRSWQSR
jgi:hypothetical protein